jgi:hypothetical protein
MKLGANGRLTVGYGTKAELLAVNIYLSVVRAIKHHINPVGT